MVPLNIPDRRERLLVRAADLALAPARLRRRARPTAAPASILCFRLERIGDLVMALPALAALRAAAPSAALDLVVGSWNVAIARAIPGIRSVEVLDPDWLAREHGGQTMVSLVAAARRWRPRRYDVAINFEPDIRSNVIAASAGASWTAGFSSGGGGALLDLALPVDVSLHTSDNLVTLVRAVAGGWSSAEAAAEGRLSLDDDVVRRAVEHLRGLRPPFVAMHVNGGRAIKQWPLDRFEAVARWLTEVRGASLVFTGSDADRASIALVRTKLPLGRSIDVSGVSLVETAALLSRCDLLVSGDTGPMHLAHAVGTPTVAIFGPSDPRRYAPRGLRDRVVRVDLPCAPCNRIRQPPERCQLAVRSQLAPDCLAGVSIAAVTAAIDDAFANPGSRGERIPTVA
jgi:heptosyltransferase-2/heptosyltransferase-3